MMATRIITGVYALGGFVCVQAHDSDGPLATLSVNVERGELDDKEFVLNHDIPPDLAEKFLGTGLFEDTGRTASYGYVKDRPIWRLTFDGPDAWCLLAEGEE